MIKKCGVGAGCEACESQLEGQVQSVAQKKETGDGDLNFKGLLRPATFGWKWERPMEGEPQDESVKTYAGDGGGAKGRYDVLK